jgi:DNA-binding NarL/FixJ family response regulator
VNQIRLLLVEHLSLVRQGIRSVLSTVGHIEVVGEASSGEEAVRLAGELEPGVILMDQDMPGTDGLQATRVIKQSSPQIEVVIMTDRLDHVRALEAIEAGATGYVLKDIPVPNLVTALRSVCDGRAFFHPEIARRLADRFSVLNRDPRTRHRLETNGLTRRELDILAELTNGNTDSDIAAKFVLSEGTVKTHIRHILRKLGSRNRTQAVAYVLRKGLIK